MTITITAQDGSGDSTTPARVKSFNAEQESGNIVTPLIAPGSIAVTLVGDLPPSGSFTILYDDDAAMLAARDLLARATTFTLVDTERPVFDMEFARRGRLAPTLHDRMENVWLLEVGFQEVGP